MGNQQERLIWLAGFIDGEGYIGIKKVKRVNPFSGYQLTSRVVVSNTNEAVFTYLKRILGENEIAFSVRYPKIEKHWKPAYKFEIQGLNPVRSLLNLVIPYLVVKLEQATIMLKFIERRSQDPKSKYTSQDIRDWQKIKELNKVSSETIRQNAEMHKI